MNDNAGDAHEALRARLLLAALPHVPFDGWTRLAIEAGAADLGLDAVEAKRLYPGGPADLFRALSDWADGRMAEAVGALPLDDMRLNERVQAAVIARLDALAPYREAVRRGLGFAAMPQHAGLGLSCFGRTVDRIWRLAGDRSADFSYYTKRALLAGVLGSTTLVWLDDNSEDGHLTRDFLARRIADVLRIQRTRGAIERRLAHLPNPFARRGV